MQLASYQKSSQHENSGRKYIKMQHCVGDLNNQDSQLEEENLMRRKALNSILFNRAV